MLTILFITRSLGAVCLLFLLVSRQQDFFLHIQLTRQVRIVIRCDGRLTEIFFLVDAYTR